MNECLIVTSESRSEIIEINRIFLAGDVIIINDRLTEHKIYRRAKATWRSFRFFHALASLFNLPPMSEKLKLRPSGSCGTEEAARFYETKPDCFTARAKEETERFRVSCKLKPRHLPILLLFLLLFTLLLSPRRSCSESSLYLSREIYTRVYAPVNAAVTRDLVSAFATVRCVLVLRIKLFSSSYIHYMYIHTHTHIIYIYAVRHNAANFNAAEFRRGAI